MAEQQQEKKKFITFKPGVRPELFKALIFMGIMIGVMMISRYLSALITVWPVVSHLSAYL